MDSTEAIKKLAQLRHEAENKVDVKNIQYLSPGEYQREVEIIEACDSAINIIHKHKSYLFSIDLKIGRIDHQAGASLFVAVVAVALMLYVALH